MLLHYKAWLWCSVVGPRLFMSCPMNSQDMPMWFTDLWNHSIVPYILNAVREGIQVNCADCDDAIITVANGIRELEWRHWRVWHQESIDGSEGVNSMVGVSCLIVIHGFCAAALTLFSSVLWRCWLATGAHPVCKLQPTEHSSIMSVVYLEFCKRRLHLKLKCNLFMIYSWRAMKVLCFWLAHLSVRAYLRVCIVQACLWSHCNQLAVEFSRLNIFSRGKLNGPPKYTIGWFFICHMMVSVFADSEWMNIFNGKSTGQEGPKTTCTCPQFISVVIVSRV